VVTATWCAVVSEVEPSVVETSVAEPSVVEVTTSPVETLQSKKCEALRSPAKGSGQRLYAKTYKKIPLWRQGTAFAFSDINASPPINTLNLTIIKFVYLL